MPLVFEIPNHGCRTRRLLVQDAKRIGFIDDIAVVMRNDVELIQRAFADAGQKSFPDTGTAASLKRMGSRVPSDEAAYYRD